MYIEHIILAQLVCFVSAIVASLGLLFKSFFLVVALLIGGPDKVFLARLARNRHILNFWFFGLGILIIFHYIDFRA